MMRSLRIGAIASLMLLMAACGSSSSSSTQAATGNSAASAGTTEVHLSDFMINPMVMNLKAGENSFHVVNDGATPHNFKIKLSDADPAQFGSKDLSKGQSDTFQANLKPGSYVGYCAEPGHESLGMKITVNVS